MLLSLQVVAGCDVTPDVALTAAHDAAMRVARVWTEPQFSHEDTSSGVRMLHYTCDAVQK